MDIIVKSKNCEISGRLKEEALQKVTHATRFFDRLLGVELVFAKDQNPRIAQPAHVEVTAHTKGHHIRVEGVGEDHRQAVDEAVSKFERQLARYKARLVDRRRGRAAVAAVAAVAHGSGNGQAATAPSYPAEPEDIGPQIVRTKRFELRPMLPEDAAFQLELLGHEFFLFQNAGTGACSVLYRRKDGQLGLIEAE